MRRRVRLEMKRDDRIHRQDDGAAGGISPLKYALRFAEQVFLVERFSNVHSARGKEGVRHSAANDQMIDLAD